nr:hypothetical protein [Tessaracoccus flavescens]
MDWIVNLSSPSPAALVAPTVSVTAKAQRSGPPSDICAGAPIGSPRRSAHFVDAPGQITPAPVH